MRQTRWLNTTQPQTLVNATILLYMTAVFDLLFVGLGAILLIAGKVAAGYGIANERKWGYILGLVISGLAILGVILAHFALFAIINSAFDIVLFALLLQPASREYQRIWFK